MRILQVHNTYREHGGEEVSVASEAELLRAGGHQVTTWSVENPERAVTAAARVALAPHNRAVARKAVAAAREWGADVVHVNNTWFSISPLIFELLDAAGIATVFTLRNYRVGCMQSLLFRDGGICTECIGRSPTRGIRHRCYRDSASLSALAAATIALAHRRDSWNRADQMLALSESQRSVLVEAGIDGSRLRVVPNTILDPGPRPALPSDSKQVLFVGRLTPEKGVTTLLDAWRRFPRGALELLVVGAGPLRPSLEANLPDGVRLTGWMAPDSVREQMLSSRALLFPTETLEPFGRGAVEALAAGLPVLGSNLGATAEVIAGLGPAWTVPASGPDAWTNALGYLSDDHAIDRASSVARAIYERDYAPTLVRGLLERAYADAIERRAAR